MPSAAMIFSYSDTAHWFESAYIFAAARPLLQKEADGTAFRLIGIGAQPLAPADQADRGDLADPEAPRRAARWKAMEALRAKFGEDAIGIGRGFGAKPLPPTKPKNG